MVNRNWLPPAVALVGEMDVMNGKGQVPQDSPMTASAIASAAKAGGLAILAIGFGLPKLADVQRVAPRDSKMSGRAIGGSLLAPPIPRIYPPTSAGLVKTTLQT